MQFHQCMIRQTIDENRLENHDEYYIQPGQGDGPWLQKFSNIIFNFSRTICLIVNQKHNKNLWTQNQKQKDSVLGFDPEEIFYEISSSLCDFQNHKYHLKQVRYVQNSTKCQYDKKSSKSYLRCDPKRDSLCPHLISDVSVNTKLVFGVLSLILSDCLIADIISY